MSDLTMTSVLTRNEAVLFSNVEDGTALMDIDSGEYYHFEAVGTRVWELIDGKRDIAAICSALLEEFDVDVETCERDTIGFLAKLSELGHVKPADTN